MIPPRYVLLKNEVHYTNTSKLIYNRFQVGIIHKFLQKITASSKRFVSTNTQKTISEKMTSPVHITHTTKTFRGCALLYSTKVQVKEKEKK